MIKHIILWQFSDEFSNEQKNIIANDAKENLESLIGKIPGLTEIKVITGKLGSSNVDMMLDSTFENEESLKNYSVNPFHTAVADKFVRPFIKHRSCMDFEI